MTDDCTLCRIVDGDRRAHRLREDERTVAFLDQNPVVEGHTLVVPKAHVEEVVAADEATVASVFGTVRRVSTALDRALDPTGFSVFHTTGPLVGRVSHAHVHVLPRYPDDGISVSLSREAPDPEAQLAARIRAAL